MNLSGYDPRARMAAALHFSIGSIGIEATHRREERDRLIRELRAEGWSLGGLAEAVGCSKTLIKQIVDRAEASS